MVPKANYKVALGPKQQLTENPLVVAYSACHVQRFVQDLGLWLELSSF